VVSFVRVRVRVLFAFAFTFLYFDRVCVYAFFSRSRLRFYISFAFACTRSFRVRVRVLIAYLILPYYGFLLLLRALFALQAFRGLEVEVCCRTCFIYHVFAASWARVSLARVSLARVSLARVSLARVDSSWLLRALMALGVVRAHFACGVMRSRRLM